MPESRGANILCMCARGWNRLPRGWRGEEDEGGGPLEVASWHAPSCSTVAWEVCVAAYTGEPRGFGPHCDLRLRRPCQFPIGYDAMQHLVLPFDAQMFWQGCWTRMSPVSPWFSIDSPSRPWRDGRRPALSTCSRTVSRRGRPGSHAKDGQGEGLCVSLTNKRKNDEENDCLLQCSGSRCDMGGNGSVGFAKAPGASPCRVVRPAHTRAHGHTVLPTARRCFGGWFN